jgi:integrase
MTRHFKGLKTVNYVEPIRDRKQIAHIKTLLKGQGRYRDLLLFVVGINTALRISDLLARRIGDFVDETGGVRRGFSLRKQKRGKRREVVINDSIREALAAYRAAYPQVEDDPRHFVFFNTRTRDYARPISRVQAWKFIVAICQDAGLTGNYGTHTLRKTWGYHARKSGVDLTLIMDQLNHNSLAYTKRYLGITDDELGEVVRRLNL